MIKALNYICNLLRKLTGENKINYSETSKGKRFSEFILHSNNKQIETQYQRIQRTNHSLFRSLLGIPEPPAVPYNPLFQSKTFRSKT
jgi:hypothetical protein